MRIAFIHPDLGIGGAERLVVDAALGLQGLGHSIDLYTSYHDPQHCFDETRDGMLRSLLVYGLFRYVTCRDFESTPRRSTVSSLFQGKIPYFIRSFASTSFNDTSTFLKHPDLRCIFRRPTVYLHTIPTTFRSYSSGVLLSLS
jgi:hypothetical protein